MIVVVRAVGDCALAARSEGIAGERHRRHDRGGAYEQLPPGYTAGVRHV
jgi:hypothetical protein